MSSSTTDSSTNYPLVKNAVIVEMCNRNPKYMSVYKVHESLLTDDEWLRLNNHQSMITKADFDDELFMELYDKIMVNTVAVSVSRMFRPLTIGDDSCLIFFSEI